MSRTRLNKPGSEKESWHIELDLAGTGIDYRVGDAFGIFPTNDPALADAVIAALHAPADFPIGGRALRDVLIDGVSLGAAPDMLFQLFSYITGGERRQKAKALRPAKIPTATPPRSTCLRPLRNSRACGPIRKPSSKRSIRCSHGSTRSRPRPRSIARAWRSASTPYAIPSTAAPGSALRPRFSASASVPGIASRSMSRRPQHFGLPADPSLPVIMIGPGTGIAPFRAFLHERMATKAPGRNWLFFGHQRHDHDFFYEDELTGMKAAGALTRLSLAWSRDGAEKFYVQDRMREVGRDLWAWIADGAHVYVCGDAKRMARDVEGALVEIVAQHGARTTDEAIASSPT